MLINNRSPSDMTIYKLAFQRLNERSDDVINKISNFVEGIRIASSNEKPRTPSSAHRSKTKSSPGKSECEPTGRSAAEEVIINAEHFKAQLQPPKGLLTESVIHKLISGLDEDDKFFNVTCHIDSSL